MKKVIALVVSMLFAFAVTSISFAADTTKADKANGTKMEEKKADTSKEGTAEKKATKKHKAVKKHKKATKKATKKEEKGAEAPAETPAK